jgi:hypothetical protein
MGFKRVFTKGQKMNTFSGDMQKLLQELMGKRDSIKEDFVRAYMASRFPAQSIEEIIQSTELVEQWTDDRMGVKWYFRERNADHMLELSKLLIEILRSGNSVAFHYVDRHIAVDVHVGQGPNKYISEGNIVDAMPLESAAHCLVSATRACFEKVKK